MAENQRETIIRIAMEKMRQVGIRSVSIDDVCRILGMSKKTFYVYFSTKEELVQAMLLRLEEEVNANIHLQLEQKSVLDLLLNMQKIMRNMRDVRKVPPLFYDLEKYYPQLYKEHSVRSRTYTEDNIRISLRRGVEEHLFRSDLDIERAGAAFIMIRESYMNLPIEERQNKKNIDTVKYAVDMMIQGILSEEGKETLKARIKNLES